MDLNELALERLTKWPAKSVEKELAYLPTALMDGEQVVNVAIGDFKDRMGKGLLVLTDRRVMFIEASGMMRSKMNMEDFPLDRVSSVTHQLGMTAGTIVIHASGNSAKIEKVQPKDRVEEITNAIRQRLAGGAPSATAAPAAPDVADQLRKLGELHAAGILTDDEFAAKKAELLARM